MDKKKIRKVLLRTGTGFLAFAGTLVGGYMLTPNKTRTVNLSFDQNGGNEGSSSHFDQFLEKLTNEVGLNDESGEQVEQKQYFKIDIDDVRVNYKLANSDVLNTVKVDGELDFAMHGLKNIHFNLDADIDYNSRKLPLEIGYFNKVAYFGLKDLRMKCSQVSLDDFGNVLNEFVFAADGLNIDDKIVFTIADKIDSLLSIETITGLLNSNKESNDGSSSNTSFTVDEKENSEGGWDFTLNVLMSKTDGQTQETTENEIIIDISSDSQYNINRVELTKLSFGDVSITGGLNFAYESFDSFISPEQRHAERNYNYIEIFNYNGWIKKLSDFLAEDQQQFGIAFDMKLDYTGENPTDIATVKGSINVDLQKLINLDQYKRGYVASEEEENVTSEEEKSLTDKVLEIVKEDVGFNFQLDLIGQENIKYAGLELTFVDGEGYFNFNETEDAEHNKSSVMKFKIDTATINWLVSELPGVINGLSGDTSSSSLSSMFSFLTDSNVVSEIKNGNYAVILDMIDTLNNDNSKINLGLDLSGLNIGDNARVDLVLDSTYSEDANVLDLKVSNLAFGDYELNMNVETNKFVPTTIGDVSTYDKLDFLPTVVDQFAGIVDTKSTGFALSGSVLDSQGLGIKLYGDGQLNNSDEVKNGFGNLTIDQYKYHSNQVWYSHKIAIDVDNKDYLNAEGQVDRNLDNALFVYGDQSGDCIKGKVTVQSVLDIVDVIKNFIKDSGNDPKFKKFLAPIVKLLGVSALADIIEAKNYLRFAGNDFVKKIAQFGNGSGIEILIGGSIIGLDSDIDLKLNFTEDKKRIDSLELVNFVFNGKTINFKLALTDYDASKVSPVVNSGSFMDLSSISLLLDMGINTTKLNYYHLTADIGLRINVLTGITLDINDVNGYVYVDGEHVMVYVVLPDVPTVIIASENSTGVQNMKSELTFKTYDENDPNREDGVGGYFDIKRTVDRKILLWESQLIYHYRTTSKNFLDNIIAYLLGDLLGFKKSVVDLIGNIGGSDEEKAAGNFAKTFTSTGYKYSVSGSGENTVQKFQIGLNLDVLTGIDALKTVEVTLASKRVNGSDYLSSLDAALKIHALVDINLNAALKVTNLGTNESWDNVKFNGTYVNTIFNSITQTSFPSSKLNQVWEYIEN